jgi:asparagine synthase (glutamine-hydrolysing)
MCGLLAYAGDVASLPDFEKTFNQLQHRGPDDSDILKVNAGEASMCFHRLAIMDPTIKGHQPFIDAEHGHVVMCNGEVYNYETLKHDYEKTYNFKSHSDCEVLVPMFRDLGIEGLCQHLDAEFALVIWDNKRKTLVAGRDPIGIRPLFYGKTAVGKMMFASEAKELVPFCDQVEAFPPGHYFDGTNFIRYKDLTTVAQYAPKNLDQHLKDIREKLIEGVRKRLVADVPVGFLLSGGLDSSLVCAIAHDLLKKPITTFAVGLDHNPIDIHYAKIVADYLKLGSNHHPVYFNKQDTLGVLDKLIWHLETWDITTVRASIGMYLVCKYIHEKTPIKVVLTGEISDELFGYKYTDFAPSPEAFQQESKKRVDELYMYDVLRADRCISAHALEARVPFGDLDFVQTVMEIHPEFKMNTHNMGKWILRKAFDGTKILPDSILWREKAAFSDAVGHSMVDYLKEFAEAQYTEAQLAQAKEKYPHGAPFTKESLLYRDIFEKHFPNQSHLIKDFWMPNKEWANCNVADPSARVLPNYGKSGV